MTGCSPTMRNRDTGDFHPLSRCTTGFVLLATTLTLAPSLAQAFPLTGRFPTLSSIAGMQSRIFSPNYDFEGIIALGNCSGSLVRFVDSQDDDPAVVLSNGHCVDLLDPGEVRLNQPDRRSFQVLSPDARKLGSVSATRLLYATMTGTDISLYELSKTYAAIQKEFDIQPLTLANTEPKVGTPIEVISGYWRRGYSCAIDRIVYELREGSWLMKNSVKYTDPGCEVVGGTSGSPVIASGSRTVVAVNNTGNEDGQACKLNNPCEVDADGKISYRKGWSYGQQTYWVYGCRDKATGDIDLTLEGCQLAAPRDTLRPDTLAE